MKYFVYILRTSSGTLYVGQTNNLEKRIKEHSDKKGKGSKYMRSFDSFDFVYHEEFDSRSNAMKREAEIKSWPKAKKETLIKGKEVL
jgi:putative endonuclease